MASVDSGVETENESNDGSFDAKSESPVVQVSKIGPIRRRCKIGTRLCWSSRDNLNDYPERKLRIAVTTNNIELVQNYLFAGFDPNCVDTMGRSPLHLAASSGYADIVRLLLENGANPNQRDRLGNTPLHLAACTNNIVVVTFLLQAGTDVSSIDLHGRSPLQLAQSKLKLLQNHMSGDDSVKDYVRIQASQVSLPKLHDNNDSSDKIPVYDNAFVANQAVQIVEMMRLFLQKRGQETEAELLSAFSSRLTLSETKEQVETEVHDLLNNLSNLSIDNTSGNQNMNNPTSSTSSFFPSANSSVLSNFLPPLGLVRECLSHRLLVNAPPETSPKPQPEGSAKIPHPVLGGFSHDFSKWNEFKFE